METNDEQATTEQKTYSVRDFIEKFNLVMSLCEKTNRETDDEWLKKAYHWRVRIVKANRGKCLACQYPDEKRKHEGHSKDEKAYEVTYSKGPGHIEKQKAWEKNMGREPRPSPATIDEVLNDILLNSIPFCWGHLSFEKWGEEYGYDTDSRKAEGIYHATERNVLMFRELIGEEAFREMVPHYQEE